jgi:ParB family chromosome partitioning protein
MRTHPPAKGGKLRTLHVDRLQSGDFQPRRVIDGMGLTKLAESIRSKGVLQPVYVRKGRNGKFEIVAGERRWHAARIAGLKQIPTIVSDVSDESALAIGLIENLHREDLNPIDQAKAMNRLVVEFGMTHQQVADTIGQSRAAVSNLIRLLELPEPVCDLLADGDIDVGHARALLALPDCEREAAARHVLDEGLSVRDVEAWVRQSRESGPVRIDNDDDPVSDTLGYGSNEQTGGLDCHERDGRYHVSFTFASPGELEQVIEQLRSLSAEVETQ